MSVQVYKVSLQAVSKNLKAATGNCDDIVDYSSIKTDDFWNIVQYFLRIQPYPYVEGQGYCSAKLSVVGPYGQFIFESYGDGVNLFMSDHGVEVTAEHAYYYVTGQLDISDVNSQSTLLTPQDAYQAKTVTGSEPSMARRWTGNILAGLFVLTGVLFVFGVWSGNKEGVLVGVIASLIGLVFFAGLAWFSRRIIGGVKSGSSINTGEDAAGATQGMMMAHMMNMNDEASDISAESYDAGDTYDE